MAALLSASIAINIAQARKIAGLENNTTTGQLVAGTAFPKLYVRDLAGRELAFPSGPKSRPTVVYVFRPSCTWCQRNGPVLSELVRQVAGKYDVVGLSLSPQGLTRFVDDHGMRMPVYYPASGGAASRQFQVTPETIVISSDGIVVASWNGAYINQTKSLVESFFSVRLPDGADERSPLL